MVMTHWFMILFDTARWLVHLYDRLIGLILNNSKSVSKSLYPTKLTSTSISDSNILSIPIHPSSLKPENNHWHNHPSRTITRSDPNQLNKSTIQWRYQNLQSIHVTNTIIQSTFSWAYARTRNSLHNNFFSLECSSRARPCDTVLISNQLDRVILMSWWI